MSACPCGLTKQEVIQLHHRVPAVDGFCRHPNGEGGVCGRVGDHPTESKGVIVIYYNFII